MQLLFGFRREPGSGEYDQIQPRKLRLMQTKAFAHHSLDAVSCYRVPHMLARNGKPKARLGHVIGPGEHCKTVIAGFDRAREDPVELRALGQP